MKPTKSLEFVATSFIEGDVRAMNNVRSIIAEIQRGRRCFIIKGAAGTGKTTLIRSLVPALRAQGLHPALMAPTGRAAMVLGKRTGCESRTIHSHIYNCTDEPIKNEEGNALKFIFPLKHGYGHDVEDTAFIVDEASMVGLSKHDNDRELFQYGSGSLLHDLIDYAGLNVPNTTNVLIFVGDPYQLPPVLENCSTPPALDESKIQELTGHEPYIVELTEVYRQTEGSGILTEATKLRKCLKHKEFNCCRFLAHEDLTIENAENFLNSLRPEIDLDDKIVIAHTNNRVKELNDLVRSRLHCSTPYPMVGERLLIIRNARSATRDGKINQFYNGEFVKVERDYEVEHHLDGFYTPKDGHKSYHFNFVWRKMDISWIYDPEHGVCKNVWVNISPIVTKEWEEDEPYAPIALYNGVKKANEDKLRKEGRLTNAALKDALEYSVLLNAPIVKFGYAVTGHKSQGGEWKHAWVDYTFGPAVHSEFFFRWAYTATTRAKQHLHALYPPAIDAIAEVFSLPTATAHQVNTTQSGSDVVVGAASVTTIAAILESKGMAVAEMRAMSSRYRVFIKEAVTMQPNGYVDVIYRGNNQISSIEVRLGSGTEVQTELRSRLIGQPVDVALGLSSGTESITARQGEVLTESMSRIVERVSSAAQRAGISLTRAQALTQYHLRTSLSSSRGSGTLDFYFDGKGRLTSLGECTIPSADYNAISEAFARGAI